MSDIEEPMLKEAYTDRLEALRMNGLSRLWFPLFCLFTLVGTRPASAQCYQFSGGNSASLTVNITSLPTPTVSQDNLGGTNFDYSFTDLTGNSLALTINGKTLGSSVFPTNSTDSVGAFTIHVDSGPLFTEFFLDASWGDLTSGFQILLLLNSYGVPNMPNGLLPNGLPTVLPPISMWLNNTQPFSTGLQLPTGENEQYSGNVTFVGACPSTLPIQITSSTLPAAGVGISYDSGQLTATGGSGSYTWTILSGALPDGFNLLPTGTILGFPTSRPLPGRYSFRLRATDIDNSSQFGEKDFTIMVLPMVSILDPVTTLLDGSQITANRTLLASQGRVVAGIAADGISQVVFRVPMSTPGDQVAVQILSDSCTDPLTPSTCALSLSSDDNGGLFRIGTAVTSAQSLPNTLTDMADSMTVDAFLSYRAPVDFARQSVLADANAVNRNIYVKFSYTSSSGTPYGFQIVPLTVFRPPVVLIHGLGSGPATWDYFEPFHSDPRFSRCLIDYEASNVLSISTNTPVVAAQIKSCISGYQMSNGGIASVQADAVVHSMGGLLVRSFANSSYFATRNTYGQGPIHKLITIGTPHLGTPFATALQIAPLICPSSGPLSAAPTISAFVLGSIIYGAVDNHIAPALLDLATNSTAIQAISRANTSRGGPLVRAHVIVGVASSAQETTNADAVKAKISDLCPALGDLLLQNGFHSLYGTGNDNIVPDTSEQALGLGFTDPNAFGILSPLVVDGIPTATRVPGVIHAVVPSVFPLGPDELAKTLDSAGNVAGSSSTIPQTVIDLLNSPVNGNQFAGIVP